MEVRDESRASGSETRRRGGRGETSETNYPHAAADIQRRRIIRYLRQHGSITTIEARAELAIMAPAARIWELRHDEGHRIITQRDSHGVARYHLLPPAQGGERV